jgi:hypothetical protein
MEAWLRGGHRFAGHHGGLDNPSLLMEASLSTASLNGLGFWVALGGFLSMFMRVAGSVQQVVPHK